MHPWIWLNEPQHSAAVQALIAVAFGLPTLLFVRAATHAAKRQAIAADSQAIAADAQADASRMAIRPVLIPTLVWNPETGRYFIDIKNVGAGVAVQIHFSFSPTKGMGLNNFIWPKAHGLVPEITRGLTGTVANGDMRSELLEKALISDFYLLLINYLDLVGDICQTQYLVQINPNETVGHIGFAMLTTQQRQALARTLTDPNDPEQCGIYPW